MNSNSIQVVVDTNVFVKAIFHRDENSKKLFQLKSQNKVCFIMNKEMQNELIVTFFKLLLSTLSKKDVQQSITLGALLSSSLWQVREIDHLSHTNYSEDIDDNKFVDCAIDSNTKYIITYDEHLNSISDKLKEEYDINVMSPFQFINDIKN